MTKEERMRLNQQQQDSRDILQEPMIDEQPVYDFLSGNIYPCEKYNRMSRFCHKAAERIYEAAKASENITCPAVEVMEVIIWRALFGEEKNQYKRAADEQ